MKCQDSTLENMWFWWKIDWAKSGVESLCIVSCSAKESLLAVSLLLRISSTQVVCVASCLLHRMFILLKLLCHLALHCIIIGEKAQNKISPTAQLESWVTSDNLQKKEIVQLLPKPANKFGTNPNNYCNPLLVKKHAGARPLSSATEKHVS